MQISNINGPIDSRAAIQSGGIQRNAFFIRVTGKHADYVT